MDWTEDGRVAKLKQVKAKIGGDIPNDVTKLNQDKRDKLYTYFMFLLYVIGLVS